MRPGTSQSTSLVLVGRSIKQNQTMSVNVTGDLQIIIVGVQGSLIDRCEQFAVKVPLGLSGHLWLSGCAGGA